MRSSFVHTAVVVLGRDADPGAPGGAVTLELCGSWDHEPPCPLAAHHTSVADAGDASRLRILFAAAPADEAEVRDRIDAALGRGSCVGPDGRTSTWTLVSTGPDVVGLGETAHAERLTLGAGAG